MKIGFFDSGIGGLSVLHEAYHMLPGVEFIFYADTDHVPYGKKTAEEILGYARESTSFLVKCGVDAIVIACNTATSVAVETLRKEYSLPIVSMEPAVKPAVEKSKEKRVLVIATPVTVREERVRNLIDRVDEHHLVDLLAMPELVSFAEREEFSGERVTEYLTRQFGTVNTGDYGALVMGCTHFNYFKDLYGQYFPEDIRLIDGNFGTVRHLAHRLNLEYQVGDTEEVHFEKPEDVLRNTTYYASGRQVTDEETLAHFMRLHNRLEEMRKIN